jgi:polyhydroxybutyrate depolymerase
MRYHAEIITKTEIIVGAAAGILMSAIVACTGQAPSPTLEFAPTAPLPPTATNPPKYLAGSTTLEWITIGSQERAFVLHIPPGYEHGIEMPLVINMHGAGSNAFQQETASQWFEKADQEGFIVVNPQAMEPTRVWIGVFLDSTGDPDVNFLRDLLVQLNLELSIDPARVYATGLSNGGTMANRLGCDFSGVLAAIAPVAGAHSGFHLCEIERPVSVLAVHGTDDRIIPYEGNGTDIPSVRTWVEAWAGRDGCDQASSSTEPYEQVTLEAWSGCAEQAEVALMTVHGGGHGWLGLEFVWESGRYEAERGATDEIWEFFKRHPKEH